MHREVFSHVKDRLQHINVRTLNRTPLQQRCGIDPLQNTTYISQRRTQQRHQLVTRDRLTLRKLSIAVASVCLATNARHNPLSRVATKMQHQIADAVRLFVRTPPDLFVV